MCHYRYEGELINQNALLQSLEEGPSSIQFTKLIEWVTTELANFAEVDDHVQAISGNGTKHFFRKSYIAWTVGRIIV